MFSAGRMSRSPARALALLLSLTLLVSHDERLRRRVTRERCEVSENAGDWANRMRLQVRETLTEDTV